VPLLRPKEFFHKTLQCNDQKGLERFLQEEVTYLNNAYTTVNSVKNAFTAYRNYFKDNEISHPTLDDVALENLVFSHLRLTDEQMVEFKKRKSLQVIEDMGDLRMVTEALIDAYLEKSVSLLRSSSYLDLIIGLSALTGRRTAETATSAEFKCLDASTILFNGQLKVKGKLDVGPYEIPTLHDAQDLVNHLAILRKAKPHLVSQSKKFHDCCSKDINLRTKKHFENLFNYRFTPKDMRALYAEICFKFINEKPNISRPLYYSRVLGHSKDDVTTAQSYDDFRIIV
jgi:hypothetical protein